MPRAGFEQVGVKGAFGCGEVRGEALPGLCYSRSPVCFSLFQSLLAHMRGENPKRYQVSPWVLLLSGTNPPSAPFLPPCPPGWGAGAPPTPVLGTQTGRPLPGGCSRDAQPG